MTKKSVTYYGMYILHNTYYIHRHPEEYNLRRTFHTYTMKRKQGFRLFNLKKDVNSFFEIMSMCILLSQVEKNPHVYTIYPSKCTT